MSHHYQRVLIIGSPGPGKSTLATKLAQRWQLPLIRLDQLFWQDDKTTITISQLQEKLIPILAEESWLIDGNYDSLLSQRLQRTDLVIYLKVSRLTAIYRVIKRYLTFRGKTAPGANPDVLDLEFLTYIWHFPAKQGKNVASILAESQDNFRLIEARNSRQVLQKLALENMK